MKGESGGGLKTAFKDALDFSVLRQPGERKRGGVQRAEEGRADRERERESPGDRSGLNLKAASRESPPSAVPNPLPVSLLRGDRRRADGAPAAVVWQRPCQEAAGGPHHCEQRLMR